MSELTVVETAAELREALAALRADGRRVGFVPTMGNLHAGHLKLVEAARARAGAVVVSIYVNPTQFSPNEDYQTYPRTPEADLAALAALGVDVVFMPDDQAVYPRGPAAQTVVEVPGLGDILCGAARPGHFRGVTTVVCRLFHLVDADIAVFGKKDYQQLLLIRLMAGDLGLGLEIVGVDTVREADGLALSSRNQYLTEEQRARAPLLYETLQALAGQITQAGHVDSALVAGAGDALTRSGFGVDYLTVRRRRDLAEPGRGDSELVILAAAWLGRARLIDNLEVDLNATA